MKEVKSFEKFLKGKAGDQSVDFKKYAKETGGSLIETASTDADEGKISVVMIDFRYGDWKVTLGSTAHMGEDDEVTCCTILEVKSTFNERREFCAYYKDWDPEGEEVISDTETALMMPLQAFKDFHALISSGNLEKADIACPFQGTGIKHKEVVLSARLVEHDD